MRTRLYTFIDKITKVITLLLLGFILFFVIGHAMGSQETGNLDLSSSKDIWTFTFFPFLYTASLVLSLFRRNIGALLSVLSILILFFLRPDLTNEVWFYLFLLPGMLRFSLSVCLGLSSIDESS